MSNSYSKTIQWLKDNNLSHLIPAFTENDLKLDELLTMDQDSIKEIFDVFEVDKLSKIRIMNNLKNLKKNKEQIKTAKTISTNQLRLDHTAPSCGSMDAANDLQQPLIPTETDEKKEQTAIAVNVDTLVFQSKLPAPAITDKALENKIKTFLDENGDYIRHWGDPILIILTSSISSATFKTDDTVSSFGNQIKIQRGETFKKKFISVSCVAFNEEPKMDKWTEKLKEICYLTSFQIRMNVYGGIEDWISLKYHPFDTRQLSSTIYNKLIEKYGKDMVVRSHLKSSEIVKVDHDLIIAMKTIKSAWINTKTRTKAKRQQIDPIKNAYVALQNGADPNLIIDDEDYRVLHYAIYISGDVVPFVKFVVNRGGDPTLGPIRVVNAGGTNEERFLWTPWYYYKKMGNTGTNMIKNGPLEKAIGGQRGGLIGGDIINFKKYWKVIVFVIIIVIVVVIWASK